MTSAVEGEAPAGGAVAATAPHIAPGATLGVIGGGQLGRMFVHAAQSMGYRTAVLDPDPLSPAGLVAHEHIRAAAPAGRFAPDEAGHFSSALIARAASVWRARYASSRPRRPASPAASRATAKSAALAAPAAPIAKVATGMPLGIWTIE